MAALSPLPIDAILPELTASLAAGVSAVLVAPPGAGKTTRVPLALLDEPWLERRKILVLEPRRIAARAAAEQMARLLGERVGETVGSRARLATAVGPRTRIEVVTEGIFTRLILDDPSLEGIGAVLFDEFHERSLDADFGLALALDARAALRPDLRILVMSATLDAAAVATVLGGAPVIRSDGRAFPVETRYAGRPPARLEEHTANVIAQAARSERGSILAFLPGQAEIQRTLARLQETLGLAGVDLIELHGGLDAQTQARAIAPAPAGRRKVVLATSVAETSITIDGVRVVVDCGLQRVPRYEPDVGLTRLETVRVSRASADQRRGRAGRTEPGVCYRLWSEPETNGLMPFHAPEIRAADLAGLLLDCAAWGETDPQKLRWLDPPPTGALEAARSQLQSLGALDGDGRITLLGRHMRDLPMPPRLSRMMLIASERGAARHASLIAAVIMERHLGGRDTDIGARLTAFERERSDRARAMRRLAAQWAKDAQRNVDGASQSGETLSTAAVLALAYPERIAKARGNNGQFLLANGRAARLDPADPLSQSPYLVIAELAGVAADARILLAAPCTEAGAMDMAADRIIETEELTFDPAVASLRARRIRRLGAIVLASEPKPVPDDDMAAAALARGIAQLGLHRLPWSKAQLQLRHRVAFVRAADTSASWPDLSDRALAATIEDWLAPFLRGRSRLTDIDAGDLANAVDALLPWDMKRRLDDAAPTHFDAPTGNRHPIDYDNETGPALSIRVQELFGLKEHPSVTDGRLPLTLQLLSPAGRPIQITRDLPGFWRGSWADVRAQMRGRYPKHPWPEDPANAVPTARAKPRPR